MSKQFNCMSGGNELFLLSIQLCFKHYFDLLILIMHARYAEVIFFYDSLIRGNFGFFQCELLSDLEIILNVCSETNILM